MCKQLLSALSVTLVLSFLACATKVDSVALDKPTLVIAVGDSETLMAIIQPANASNQKVAWKIDNAELASISANGTINAKGIGSATITVTTKDGGKTATCDLKTIPNVFLDQKSLPLNVGDTQTLMVSTKPANAIESGIFWSSSNKAVATVNDKGLVKAVGQGSATITATATDGGKSASCDLTVVLPVSGVTLDKTALTLEKGSSRTLSATVHPTNATNPSLRWSSNNTAVAIVNDDGIVIAISSGRATISVTSDDGGKSASCNVFVEPSDSEWISNVQDVCMARAAYLANVVSDLSESGFRFEANHLFGQADLYAKNTANLIRSYRTAMSYGDSGLKRTAKDAIISYHQQLPEAYRTLANILRGQGMARLALIYSELAPRIEQDLERIR